MPTSRTGRAAIYDAPNQPFRIVEYPVRAVRAPTNDLRGDAVQIGDRITWTEYWTTAPSYERDVLDMPQKSPDVRKYGHERSDVDPHFTGGLADYCYLQPGTGLVRLP